MMSVGMDRNYRTPGGIACHALLLSYGWNRGQSSTDSQRCEANCEFETHGFSSLILQGDYLIKVIVYFNQTRPHVTMLE
jgi:hypothetical protein